MGIVIVSYFLAESLWFWCTVFSDASSIKCLMNHTSGSKHLAVHIGYPSGPQVQVLKIKVS